MTIARLLISLLIGLVPLLGPVAAFSGPVPSAPRSPSRPSRAPGLTYAPGTQVRTRIGMIAGGDSGPDGRGPLIDSLLDELPDDERPGEFPSGLDLALLSADLDLAPADARAAVPRADTGRLGSPSDRPVLRC